MVCEATFAAWVQNLSHSRHSSIHPFIHTFTHSSICLTFTRSFVRLLFHWFIRFSKTVGASYDHWTNRLNWKTKWLGIPGCFYSVFIVTLGLCTLAGKPSATDGDQKYAQGQNDGACEKCFICNSGPQQLQPMVHNTLYHMLLHRVALSAQASDDVCTEWQKCSSKVRAIQMRHWDVSTAAELGQSPLQTSLLMLWSADSQDPQVCKGQGCSACQSTWIGQLINNWTTANTWYDRSQAKAFPDGGKL